MWSESFNSFVRSCLRKDPGERMSTAQAKEVGYVSWERGSWGLLDRFVVLLPDF